MAKRKKPSSADEVIVDRTKTDSGEKARGSSGILTRDITCSSTDEESAASREEMDKKHPDKPKTANTSDDNLTPPNEEPMEAENEEELWDISSDFLKPLTKLLDDFEAVPEVCLDPKTGEYAGCDFEWSYVLKGLSRGDYLAQLQTVLDRAELASVWLEVHTSIDLANRFRTTIQKVKEQVFRSEVEVNIHLVQECNVYLGYLAAVLQTRNKAIRKSEIPQYDPKTPPMPKVLIAEIFLCGKDQVYEEVLKEHAHWPQGSKARPKYRMLVRDMPPDTYPEIIKKYMQERRTKK